jgi:hypothetical protein
MAMAMGTAFGMTKALSMTTRDEKSEELQNYPEDVMRCHEAYLPKVQLPMGLKGEVVWGSAS